MNYLLLGAGFSKNWGGLLASEVFDQLLGQPEMRESPNLRELLYRAQPFGGFETALSDLQTTLLENSATDHADLDRLQSAIRRVFDRMNRGFEHVEFECTRNLQSQTSQFLAGFDAIFTLNQDLLLEQRYMEHMNLLRPAKWNAAELPGMEISEPHQAGMQASRWAGSKWRPQPDGRFAIRQRVQPIYKLHGSMNWHEPDGRNLLIMGGSKLAAIRRVALLSWYANVFDVSLRRGENRLVVIGYGFADPHINEIIEQGVAGGALRLFLIHPRGMDLARALNPAATRDRVYEFSALERAFMDGVLGVSRLRLPEVFNDVHILNTQGRSPSVTRTPKSQRYPYSHSES